MTGLVLLGSVTSFGLERKDIHSTIRIEDELLEVEAVRNDFYGWREHSTFRPVAFQFVCSTGSVYGTYCVTGIEEAS